MLQSFSHLSLNLPGSCPDNAGLGNNGVWFRSWLHPFKQLRQCVGHDVPRPRPVGGSRKEATKEQDPPGLTRAEGFSRTDVLQVFMVGPDHERLLRTLKPVSPLLESQFYRQQFAVSDVIIPFCGG